MANAEPKIGRFLFTQDTGTGIADIERPANGLLHPRRPLSNLFHDSLMELFKKARDSNEEVWTNCFKVLDYLARILNEIGCRLNVHATKIDNPLKEV
jgi:hypothetical protein